MPRLPETSLVNSIREAILKEYPDAWVLKVHGNPYQDSGVPDLLVCLNGFMYGLEVKARRSGESEEHARSRATLRQQAQIDKIRASGGRADVVLTKEEALFRISEWMSERGIT